MFVGKKALQFIAVTNAGVICITGIVVGAAPQIGFVSVMAFCVGFKSYFYRGFAFVLCGYKHIFQFIQVDVFYGRLEKIFQRIVQRAFAAAILSP